MSAKPKRKVPVHLRSKISEPYHSGKRWGCRLLKRGFPEHLRDRVTRQEFKADSPADAINAAKRTADLLETSLGPIKTLSEATLQAVLRKAQEIHTRTGVDPVEALEEGTRILKARTDDDRRMLSNYWSEFHEITEAKTKSSRSMANVRRFKKNVDSSLLKVTVGGIAGTPKDAQSAVAATLQKRFGISGDIKKNTYNEFTGYIRRFLVFVGEKTGRFGEAEVRAAIRSQHAFQKRLVGAESNQTVSTDQLRFLFNNWDARFLPWLTFKSRMGVRTLLLQEYRWEFFDLENGWAKIPSQYTKLKHGNIEIDLSKVPTLLEWIKWAFEIAGSPKPRTKIVKFTQPTVTNSLVKFMRKHPDTFSDLFAESGKLYRNLFRNTFITNSLRDGSFNPSLVVEDFQNLNQYLNTGREAGTTPESKQFFEFLPSDVKRAKKDSKEPDQDA